MPNIRECSNSGALIFDLTPDELNIKVLQDDNKELKDSVKSLLMRIEQLESDRR